MDCTEIYDKYNSSESCTLPYNSVYTDQDGYVNEIAFYDFTDKLVVEFDAPDYFLVCLNIDLRAANSKSLSYGDYVLRRFIKRLSANYLVFRIQGEKFNILVTKDQIPAIKAVLEEPNEDYSIYYGIVEDEHYNPKSVIEQKEIRRKGVALMYASKGEKLSDRKYTLIAGKGNTPKELQETKLKKFCSTMWYSVISLTLTDPVYKEVTIYVYPTEYKEARQSMPILVIVDDAVDYNVKFESTVHFGINGIRFFVNCRFNAEGHMDTVIFAQDKCKMKTDIQTHEGVCIPASFGKRLSNTMEIYPIKKNMMGMYDFVTLKDGNTPVLNTDGYVTTPNGAKYGVFVTTETIELIELK